MAEVFRFADGAESGGLEAVIASVGTAIVQAAAAHSGVYGYQLDPAATQEYIELPVAIATNGSFGSTTLGADEFWCFGFWFRSSDVTPAASRTIAAVYSATPAVQCSLTLETTGNLLFKNVSGTTLLTITTPVTDATWHFIEIKGQNSTSGAWEVFIDGVSKGSGSAAALRTGTADTVKVRLGGLAAAEGTVYVDDFYIITDTAAELTAWRGCEVFCYQQDLVNATDQGSTLSLGTWNLAGKTPIVTGSSDEARYSAGLTGYVIMDEGANAAGHPGGPFGGSYTVTGTIKAAVGLWQVFRTNGTSPVMVARLGNNTDGVVDSGELALGTSAVRRVMVSVLTTVVPTASEYFAQGMGTTSGSASIRNVEQWANLVHVPASAATQQDHPVMVRQAPQRAAVR